MHLKFADLPAFDQDSAKAFYVHHLGCLVAAEQPMGPDGWRWIELRFPGAETTVHLPPRKRESHGHRQPLRRRWEDLP